MNIAYTCSEQAFCTVPSPDVAAIDVPRQLALLFAFFGQPMDEEDAAAFADLNASGRQEDFGVIVQGRLVARACIWNFSPERHEIAAVKVLPEHRRKGYAKQLVSHCTALLLSRGHVPTGITEDTNAAMRQVFHSLGYTEA